MKFYEFNDEVRRNLMGISYAETVMNYSEDVYLEFARKMEMVFSSA